MANTDYRGFNLQLDTDCIFERGVLILAHYYPAWFESKNSESTKKEGRTPFKVDQSNKEGTPRPETIRKCMMHGKGCHHSSLF